MISLANYLIRPEKKLHLRLQTLVFNIVLWIRLLIPQDPFAIPAHSVHEEIARNTSYQLSGSRQAERRVGGTEENHKLEKTRRLLSLPAIVEVAKKVSKEFLLALVVLWCEVDINDHGLCC